MDYQFKDIEKKWQKFWADHQTFKAEDKTTKPKYYVLDMFPYPSGAGLHVGHPLGYIASDIFARYKRLKGFNVLHPMGYDSFGLPAEQYAIQTGQHPAITTEANIATYRRQLDQIGFSFDWSREVRTSSPNFYKWTQWIFMRLYNSWYNKAADKAESIEKLVKHFENYGSAGIDAVCDDEIKSFTAEEWKAMNNQEQQAELLKYRLTYLRESTVNWCAALGTVLANDEVKDGFSERGGYPVEQKKMMQWSMRITAYADRLLKGLETIDWPEPLKEMQRNWIGKSVGALVRFSVAGGSVAEGSVAGDEESVTGKQTGNTAQATGNHPTGNTAQITGNPLTGNTAQITGNPLTGNTTQATGNHPTGNTAQITGNPLTGNTTQATGNHPTGNTAQATGNHPTGNTTQTTGNPLTGNTTQATGNHIEVFTTRADTIFGTTFLVIAPEHELVQSLTTPEQKADIEGYIAQAKKKSELERMADAKTVSGAFTGSYAINPVNGEKIPVWIADYVLAGYGTGAVMAVPSGDQRDYLFAKHYNLPIIPIIDIQKIDTEADPTKEGRYINSGFINGLTYKEATAAVIAKLEETGAGKAKVNFRMRDAIFGRQRYWGEPVPVYFKGDLPYLISEQDLPLVLPEVDKYLPTESGEPPLARAADWKYRGLRSEDGIQKMEGSDEVYEYELSTMPGWAGSSWYWYRYMDAHNDKVFASKQAIEYWRDVDLYIGGSEHATGHLLYSRFWNKFMRDLDLVIEEEPFKKLINQGMIQGRSNLVYRLIDESGRSTNTFVSHGLIKQYKTSPLHVDVNIVENDVLNIEKFKKWRPEYTDAEFILEGGKYICGVEIEKMSKSKFNVVNPDDLIERYGADTLRMYEMFLGPLEQSKPWNTNGIEGVFKFLRKFWRLFHNDAWEFNVSNEEATKAELKSLHKIIRKVEEDIERFSFNTSVSSFMIAVNELTDLKCNKRSILQDMVIILSPYAPHICEELWTLLGNKAGTLSYDPYPQFNAAYLVEDEFSYPISINGKTKMNLNISLSLEPKAIEALVLADEGVKKYLNGNTPKKVIVVKGRIVNIVL